MGSSCVVRFSGLSVAVWRLGLLAVFLAATRAEAADRPWRDPDGGTFSNAGNWSSGVPGAGDVAVFGLSTPGIFGALPPYTVSFIADATNQGLRVSDDRVTFDLNGHVYTTSDAIVAMQLGMLSGASGRLTVTDGIVILPFQSDLQIASTSGGSGLLAVAAGGLVIGSPELIVGLNGNGALNIDNNGDLIADHVTIGANTGSIGTANIAGGGSSLNSTILLVGDAGTGSLNIIAGGRVESTIVNIASDPGGIGTATIDGANSIWKNSGNLSVGSFAAGTMNITAGGLVQNVRGYVGIDGPGTVHVDGLNSRWLNSGDLLVAFEPSITGIPSTGLLDVANRGRVQADTVTIGESGNGTLNISSGGRVDSTSSSIASVIASNPGSTGTATIDGVDSTWLISSNLIIGSPGAGTMNITAGGLVQNATGYVGNDGGTGTVHVDGLNSRWLNSGDLLVGFDSSSTGLLEVANGGRVQANRLSIGVSGNGELNISSGGHVDSRTSTLGMVSGTTGSVAVTGAGSTWTIDGELHVGNDGIDDKGVGALRIQPGGAVAVDGFTKLHQGDSVVLEGGALSTFAIDFVLGHGTFQWTSGTLRVRTYDGNLQVPDGGVLAPGVTFLGMDFNSTLVEGGYNQKAGASLEIDFFPLSSGGGTLNDNVVVTDTAVLGGTLALKLVDGAAPDPSANFTIFDALSIAGAFANVANGQRLTTVDGLGSFFVNYGAGSPFDPSQIVLSGFLASVGLPGDYNQNGAVDAADYVLWRNNLGSGTSLPNDDTSGVGLDDYTRWRTHFGQTAGSGTGTTATAAVPEPATFVLLMFTVAGWCLRRGRGA